MKMASHLQLLCVLFIILTLVNGDLEKNKAKIPNSLTYPGDIYIGVFIDLHKSSVINQTELCSELNTEAVQQLWSAIWAVDTINNQTEADMPKLGLKVYDTCDNGLVALHHTINLLKQTVDDFPHGCQQQETTVMLGVVGIGEANALRPTLGLLQVYSVPMVLATPSAASGLPAQSNVLTTAPTMASLVQAVVSIVTELHWKSIYALSTSPAAMKDLAASVVSRDVTVVQAITLSPGSISYDTFDRLLSAKKVGSPRVFILMLEPKEMDQLVSGLSDRTLGDDIFVVVTPSIDKNQAAVWGQALKMGFIVTPHPLHLQEFRASFLSALAGRGRGRPVAIDNYLEKVYNCSQTKESNRTHAEMQQLCSDLNFSDLQRGFSQDSSVPFISKAVSALAAALRMVQIDKCKLGTQCVRNGLNGSIVQDIMAALRKLSFSIQGNEPMEVEGTRLKFTEDGKLVFKHCDVYAFNGSSAPIQVGYYSDNIGLNLNVAWRQQSGETRLYHTLSELEVMETAETGDVTDGPNSSTGKSSVNVFHFHRPSFVTRGWATAVVAIAGIGILMTAYIFIYVMVKICDRTLTGNQFLGIFLLLSVIMLYATCMLYVVPPSEAICNWRLFMHSVSYALCYGVLFVKVMQLRSLVSLGLGGRLSHLNQAFTLFFIVGLQVGLNVQWSVLTRPVYGFSERGELHCLVSKTDFVSLQSYTFLLLLLTCGYALYTRHVRRNHNEGRWVLLASLLSVPVWIAWIAAYLSLPDEHREPTVCAGLIVAATVVVCTIFLPKMRTLSARSRPGTIHKDISSTNSTATVFSLTNDLETISRKSSKSFPSSLFAESLLRNPMYDFKDKRFPTMVENKSEKRLEVIAETAREK